MGNSSSNEPLRLNEVGGFRDLSARPNPSGFIVLTVPPFETMLPFFERQLGRRLTDAEIVAKRASAPSIVVTAEKPAQMSTARGKGP
jgi:hypothetical protein